MVSGAQYSSGSGWYSPYSNPLQTIVGQIRTQLMLLKPLADNLRPDPLFNRITAAQARDFTTIANALDPLVAKLQALEGQVTPNMLSPNERQFFLDQVRDLTTTLRNVTFTYGEGGLQREFLVNALRLNDIRSLVFRYTKNPADATAGASSSNPAGCASPYLLSTPEGYSPYSGGSNSYQTLPSYAQGSSSAAPVTPGGYNPYSGGSSASQPLSGSAQGSSSVAPATPGGYNPYSNNTPSLAPAATGNAGGGLLGYDVNGVAIYDPAQAYRIHYAKNAGM